MAVRTGDDSEATARVIGKGGLEPGCGLKPQQPAILSVDLPVSGRVGQYPLAAHLAQLSAAALRREVGIGGEVAPAFDVARWSHNTLGCCRIGRKNKACAVAMRPARAKHLGRRDRLDRVVVARESDPRAWCVDIDLAFVLVAGCGTAWVADHVWPGAILQILSGNDGARIVGASLFFERVAPLACKPPVSRVKTPVAEDLRSTVDRHPSFIWNLAFVVEGAPTILKRVEPVLVCILPGDGIRGRRSEV